MKESRWSALELANQTTPWTGPQLSEIDGMLRDYARLKSAFDELLGECRMIHKEATRRDRYSPQIVEEVSFQLDVAIEKAEKATK